MDHYVEVPDDLTLGQAHDRVSRLEVAVREELAQVRGVHSHIEPLAAPVVRQVGRLIYLATGAYLQASLCFVHRFLGGTSFSRGYLWRLVSGPQSQLPQGIPAAGADEN